MKVINLARQAGKTTRLIKMAHEHNGYIVCLNQEEVAKVVSVARKLKLNINFPLTFSEFLSGEYHGAGVKKVFIDNADMMLQQLSSVKVEAITVNDDERS